MIVFALRPNYASCHIFRFDNIRHLHINARICPHITPNHALALIISFFFFFCFETRVDKTILTFSNMNAFAYTEIKKKKKSLEMFYFRCP